DRLRFEMPGDGCEEQEREQDSSDERCGLHASELVQPARHGISKEYQQSARLPLSAPPAGCRNGGTYSFARPYFFSLSYSVARLSWSRRAVSDWLPPDARIA